VYGTLLFNRMELQMFARIFLFALLALSCSGCMTFKFKVGGEYPPPVNHIVLCWLKDSGNAAQRAELVKISKSFLKVPGVQEVRVGPVISSERDIVDDSFDVAIFMTFDTVEDMNAYIVHPEHAAAVKDKLKPLVSKIVVYDFRNE
jgi:hypothetical protein